MARGLGGAGVGGSPGVAVFDIVGTCFSLDRPRQALTGLGAPPGLLDTWFAQSLRDSFALSHAGGYVPLMDVVGAALRRLLFRASVPHVAADVEAVLATFAELDPRPDLFEAAEHLSSRGWRLVALTNWSEELAAGLLRRAGVADKFGAVISCDAISVTKPNGAVYQLVADRHPGAERWMIAAHAWDIAGASRARMRTAFVTSVEGLYLDVYPVPNLIADTLLAVARRLAP